MTATKLTVLATALLGAACGRSETRNNARALDHQQAETGCFSVTSFDVRTRPDGHVESHRPVALDEKDRLLVQVGAASDSGYEAIAPSAFVWDGGRRNLAPPADHRFFSVDDMNERGEIVGSATAIRDSAQQFAYVWRDLKPVALGVQTDGALHINEHGHVAGTMIGADASRHAFLWRDGAVIDLGRGSALDLNDADQVVGWDMELRAVIWRDDGSKTEVGVRAVPSGFSSDSSYAAPLFINGRGDVAGSYRTSVDPERNAGFFAREGLVRELSLAGRDASHPVALSDRGDVAGTSYEAEPFSLRAFSLSSGGLRDLGTLGGNNSSAFAVNELGAVVGYSESDVTTEPVLWVDGRTEVLPVGAYRDEFTTAWLINDRGTVAGTTAAEHGYYTRTLFWKLRPCNGEEPDAGPPEPPPPEEPTE